MASINNETRRLSLHPLAIYTFIKAQAGSLGKALSEAVMNSIDAFAHNVTITLTESGFVIEDDGQGFKSKEEIAAWFETLGFPHDEGNHRTYGQFGMGRAQMWAYARTVWESNQFVMHVDIQKTGLDYQLEERSQATQGTRIEAVFYTPLSFQQRELVEMELRNLVRYVGSLVTINGQAINRLPETETWDFETPEAYMRFDKKMYTLDVYNGGVLVAHFPRYRFKAAGTIVTKPSATLALNLARNDILEAECQVWRKIITQFPELEEAHAKKSERKPKVVAAELEVLAKQVVAGTLSLKEALIKAPNLLVGVNGRVVSFDHLARYYSDSIVTSAPKGDELGKRVQKLKKGVVIANESLQLFGFAEVSELKPLVRADVEEQHRGYQPSYLTYALDRFDARVWSSDIQGLFEDLAEGRVIYARGELTDEESVVQQAWARAWLSIRSDVIAAFDTPELKELATSYSVCLGDSALRSAWVSQQDLVLRKKEVIKAAQGAMPQVMAHFVSVLNEILLSLAPTPAQAHQKLCEFLTTPAAGKFALVFSRNFIRGCREKDIVVKGIKLEELDAVGAE